MAARARGEGKGQGARPSLATCFLRLGSQVRNRSSDSPCRFSWTPASRRGGAQFHTALGPGPLIRLLAVNFWLRDRATADQAFGERTPSTTVDSPVVAADARLAGSGRRRGGSRGAIPILRCPSCGTVLVRATATEVAARLVAICHACGDVRNRSAKYSVAPKEIRSQSRLRSLAESASGTVCEYTPHSGESLGWPVSRRRLLRPTAASSRGWCGIGRGDFPVLEALVAGSVAQWEPWSVNRSRQAPPFSITGDRES